MNGVRPYPSDGLGLMHIKLSPKVDNLNLSITVGHGGADWGSIALINGFNPRFNFSFVLGVNSVAGMNCTREYRETYPLRAGTMYVDNFYYDAGCPIYNEVLQVVTNGTAYGWPCAHACACACAYAFVRLFVYFDFAILFTTGMCPQSPQPVKPPPFPGRGR